VIDRDTLTPDDLDRDVRATVAVLRGQGLRAAEATAVIRAGLIVCAVTEPTPEARRLLAWLHHPRLAPKPTTRADPDLLRFFRLALTPPYRGCLAWLWVRVQEDLGDQTFPALWASSAPVDGERLMAPQRP
jgi:hypothetical protein